MVGIYKITNDLNGKSYIGQSIHCGKRLDEHCTGNQFIDEVIQLEGINNFSFKILKEVPQSELSIWEDYYIIKNNTMFPNGYNKKWNTPFAIRQKIQNINTEDAQEVDFIVKSLVKRIEGEKIMQKYDKEEVLFSLAKEIQKEYYDEDRICTKEDLEDFYKKGIQKAQNRKTIDVNTIIRRDCKVTETQKGFLEEIERLIKAYNKKENDWSVFGLDLIDSDNIIPLKNQGLEYLNSHILCPFYKNKKMIGIPNYREGNHIFLENVLVYWPHFYGTSSFNSFCKLLDNGCLNKDKIKILDKNDEEFDKSQKYEKRKHYNLKILIIP